MFGKHSCCTFNCEQQIIDVEFILSSDLTHCLYHSWAIAVINIKLFCPSENMYIHSVAKICRVLVVELECIALITQLQASYRVFWTEWCLNDGYVHPAFPKCGIYCPFHMYPYTSSCNCDEVHANILIVICLGMYLHTPLQHHQNQQFLDTLRIGALMQVKSWFSLPEHCTLSNTICPIPKYVERFTSVTITVAKLLSQFMYNYSGCRQILSLHWHAENHKNMPTWTCIRSQWTDNCVYSYYGNNQWSRVQKMYYKKANSRK